MLGLTRYQWLVLFAAWLGWGFDVFDGLLFNFVSPICVPNLLHINPAAPDAKQQVFAYTAILTSLLLLGWACGGVLFGRITDRLGRTRTLLLTMLTYALSTAACAFAPNLPVLAVFRFFASLGIGGEWAAGAALVAESLPFQKRVLGGALLYTSAPVFLFIATFVNYLFTSKLEGIAANPNLSWRAVFLTGLVPAIVAVLIRLRVREPEVFKEPEAAPRILEIFTPRYKRRTLGGLALALVALVTWWSCSAFIPAISGFLVSRGDSAHLPAKALAHLKSHYITLGTTWFNLGGLIGTLLTVPIAMRFGRRPMFLGYFTLGALAVLSTFGLTLSPEVRLMMMFTIGITVFGIFGSFTFYLPELFPVRLRGTGSGFCYNAGRVITSAFPFIMARIALSGVDPLKIVVWVALAPAIGVVLLLAGVGLETRDFDADAEAAAALGT
ncbi:MAG TPA: MFS transporter [Polyangiaceae bacterium]|jgi:MFS family permease|nr:MFS transporter [Polyangiaceae bacterium]